MAATPSSSAGDSNLSFELKAAAFTLPVIRLLTADMEDVAAQLGARVEQAPDFFRNTPVVIDLSIYPPDAPRVELPLLVGLLRGYGMIPFGVRGGTKAQNAAAEAMELAILGDNPARPPKSAPPTETRPGEPQAGGPLEGAAGGGSANGGNGTAGAGSPSETLRRGVPTFTLVTRPVRSGQRIYATGGDLSVVAPVSSGAELMADGNIHVYGPLRGRALAGLAGNTHARIFCQALEAELVSVAGHYRVSESFPPELRGAPVQIYLDQKVLRIEKL